MHVHSESLADQAPYGPLVALLQLFPSSHDMVMRQLSGMPSRSIINLSLYLHYSEQGLTVQRPTWIADYRRMAGEFYSHAHQLERVTSPRQADH